jgi:hypothetical protein
MEQVMSGSLGRLSVLVRCWPLSMREITDFVVPIRSASSCLGQPELRPTHDHDPGDLLERAKPILSCPCKSALRGVSRVPARARSCPN